MENVSLLFSAQTFFTILFQEEEKEKEEEEEEKKQLENHLEVENLFTFGKAANWQG